MWVEQGMELLKKENDSKNTSMMEVYEFVDKCPIVRR